MKLTRLILIAMAIALLVTGAPVLAATDCTFTTTGNLMVLDGDCMTDATIYVPDGMTLDGADNMITAVDPGGDHFRGAVVANGGDTAHVRNLVVTTSGLANVCDGGDDRLRGIMLEGASGSITHNVVVGLNQGASGCQEGNAVEVRNAPFDGTHLDTQFVEVSHNTLLDWQKTGIVCNGDVYCSVQHNDVDASATQDNLAANSIQFGFGALGFAKYNLVEGNEWRGLSDYAATAFLIYQTGDGLEISQNNVRGNSDIGIYFFADNGTVFNNRVFDVGDDHPNSGYDIGLGNWGSGNAVKNNKVRGFEIPYDGVEGGNNKAIPGPSRGQPFN